MAMIMLSEERSANTEDRRLQRNDQRRHPKRDRIGFMNELKPSTREIDDQFATLKGRPRLCIASFEKCGGNRRDRVDADSEVSG